ncbi:hypothetical protein IVB12_15855 [Bradyrhizobium sp. 179]|uniref:hypothetical protein n=1 Tax=Bradyrhizobium sp. 179 TaxID=2782648 RepID=UPI001FFB9C6B|nr:hypothetical protein [Bradyrhizobium sp. 179]MCK1543391.1 hypothetical protein [Bradyrhizobium sp. 179]
MSYYDAIMRASEKANARARKQQREVKHKLFEIVETLDIVEFDESEVFDLAEAHARYAIAH